MKVRPHRGLRRRAAAARSRQLGARVHPQAARRTSSRWRSCSPTGRASPSTATRCAGRSGRSASASRRAKGWCCTRSATRRRHASGPSCTAASICEMVVPYGDPGEQYYRKNAFDIGEYGIGTLANSLALGCDCLGTIRYFDAHYARQPRQGRHASRTPSACTRRTTACSGSTPTGAPTRSEARRSRRLSVSFIATVGNYEYGFYWYFYQDGTIQCEVKLTGIMNTTALQPGEKSALRRRGGAAAERAVPPAHLRRPARHRASTATTTRSTR